MKKIKRIIGQILSAFFIVFSIIGILGILVCHDSFSDVLIGLIWTLLGLIAFYFSWKLVKIEKCDKNKKSSKSAQVLNTEKLVKSIPGTEECLSAFEKQQLEKKQEKLEGDQVEQARKQEVKEEKFELLVPKYKNSAPLAYQYGHQEILDLNYNLAIEAAQNNCWELTAEPEEDSIALYSNHKKIGILGGIRVDMLKDWIRNKDPYTIYLEGINSQDKKAIAYIAFYRDKRTKMSYREQTIVKLTNFRKEDSQMIISYLKNGDELELTEEYNDNADIEYVGVEESYTEIGRLPKKVSNRYSEEGAAGCFFDHADYDDDKDIYIPYVVIYW